MLLEESRAYYWSQVNPYFDVFPYDWYNNAISTMTNADIVEGYPDDSFRPNGNITRAEFAAMAVSFFTGEDVDVNDNVFPDVQDHWANYEINLAYAHDLIQGYPDGTFRPDQEITRAEAMTILGRMLEKGYGQADLSIFSDQSKIPAWAKTHVATLVELGVVNGSGGQLRPGASVTRAEVSKMLLTLW
jgi:hypothetical protein